MHVTQPAPRPARYAYGVGLCLTLALILLGAGLASASATHDGNWSVAIWTEKGPCDRGYRYELRVKEGLVSLREPGVFDVNGRVERGGRLTVTVSLGDRHASGTGRLSDSSGRGTWRGRSQSQECSGYWEAERR